jgi:hypothetical protein
MGKTTVVLLSGLILVVISTACETPSNKVTFEIEELQEDFRQLRDAVESLHPALYEFTGKSEFDSLFDRQYRRIDRPMVMEEFYRIVKPIVARIGCGHCRIHTPEGYWYSTPRKLFPLELAFLESGAYVLRSYAQEDAVESGSEIISINNEPILDIAETLKSNISVDGLNESRKSYRLNEIFVYLYALIFGYSDSFVVEYREPGHSDTRVAAFPAVGVDTIEKALGSDNFDGRHRGPDLELGILDDHRTAIITMKTFAYYDEHEVFYRFVDDAFARIREQKVENLILDFRGNDGGDPFCTTYLLSYIEPRPVPYFAKRYRQYAKFARPIPRAQNPFEGNILTLIDGGCFSSTGHLCAVLKYNGIGTFIGTETGGTYTCNNASKSFTLDNTRIEVNIARMTFTAAVHGMTKSSGILPDYIVEPGIDDLIEGRDPVMDFALGLIGIPAQDF